MKKCVLLSILLIMSLVVVSHSARVLWTYDQAPDNNWSNPLNWTDFSAGAPGVWPFRAPNQTDSVVVNSVGQAFVVDINGGYAALADSLEISLTFGPATVNVNDGSLTVGPNNLSLASTAAGPDYNLIGYGILNVQADGVVNCSGVHVGQNGKGELNIYDGVFNADRVFISHGDPCSAEGHIVVDGGTLNTVRIDCQLGNLPPTDYVNTSTITVRNGGVIDVTGGLHLGDRGRSELYLKNGGEMTVAGLTLLGWESDAFPKAFGYIKIEDGTYKTKDIYCWKADQYPKKGKIDIYYGSLILDGDQTPDNGDFSRVNYLVGHGILVAGDGQGTIESVYDPDEDVTIVTASGLCPQYDLTYDCQVDLQDISKIAGDWLSGI